MDGLKIYDPSIYEKDGLSFRTNKDEGDYLLLSSKNLETSFKQIKKIGIKNVEINYTKGFELSNLDFLSNYSFVEGISLVINDEIDVSGLSFVQNLKFLSINKELTQVIDLEQFQLLECLSIAWNKKIKSLSKCENLKALSLGGYKGEDLTELSDLINLTDFSLDFPAIKRINGIDNCKKLKTISIAYARKLNSLSGLENLTNIKILYIDNCSKIEDINSVAKLENLELLSMHDCKEIRSILPIKNLKKLAVVGFTGTTLIKDGDLTPLIGRKDATFSPRKFYSHTEKEIDRLNNTTRIKQTWDY